MPHSLFSGLKRLAGGVFGEFHWSPPRWLRGLVSGSWHLVRRHPLALAGTGVIVAAGTWGGVKWWQWKEAHRARPDVVVNVLRKVGIRAADPGAPRYIPRESRFEPAPLTISFSGPSAPLGAIIRSQSVTGVLLKPEHPGSWYWTSDSSLSFRASAPWPPGRPYTVTLGPGLALQPEVQLTDRKVTVTTLPVSGSVGEMEFYIDPRDPANQQVVGSVRITHPFRREELERHLSLTVLGGTPLFDTSGPPWTLVPDADDPRRWWVRSPRVIVPAKEDFAILKVTPGLVSVDGGEAMTAEPSETLVVRDKFSGFGITEVTGPIVSNEEGEPVPHLFMATKGFAAPAEMASRVEVRHLSLHGDAEPWAAPASIPAGVLAAAPVVQLTPVPADAPVTGMHRWRLPPLAPGQLLVTVPKGLPALGGYELEDDYRALIPVAEFPRLLEFTTRGGLLPLEGERKLALKARGVSHIRYTIARIPASQVNHLASMTRGRFESPSWRTYAFGPENIAHIRRVVVPTGMLNHHEAVYPKFDFNEALAAADPSDPDASRGMYFLSAEAVKPRPKPRGEPGPAEGAAADEADGGEGDGNGTAHADDDWQFVRVERSPLRPFNETQENGGDSGDPGGNSFGPSRFILVTDLGLLVKENADASRDVFVQAIREGGPATGVTLTIVAKNGETLATATTDQEGHAKMESVNSFTGERKPVALVARRGSDVAFLPLNRLDRQLDHSRFDTGGLTSGGPDALDAFVFTERGVYRPGDTVHASLIVRRRAGGLPPAGLPVTINVRNAASRMVFSQTLPLPADGMLECQGKLREADPTGLFHLQVQLFADRPEAEQIGRTVFRVEDFEPDRMKLKADLPGVPSAGWTLNPDITAVLDLQTLFGFPAAGRRITGRLDLSPASFRFAEYPDYTFHDASPVNLTAGHERNLGEIKSAEDGSGKFALGLNTLAHASVAFTFTAEAFEPDSGRSVAVARSGLLSPMATVVGWKPDGSLGYIGKDAPRQLHLICLSPEVKPVASPVLTWTRTVLRHVSVLTKLQSGSYAYVSTEKSEIIDQGSLTIPAGGLPFTLPTGEPGSFQLEFHDPEKRLAAVCHFTVTGKGDGSRSLEQAAELEMNPARTDWQSGEDLELSLRAPFTGAGLLTIEREKVLGWKWFRSRDKDSVQTIRVPDGFEGTAYVHAAFVRGMDSPEVFMSPLSYAVQPIRANYDRRLMPLTLSAVDRIRPGEVLQIQLKSPVPARAVIYAVDEGIHQITNYELPQPRDFFLRPRALEVVTTQIVDLLMPEFSLLGRSRAFGGDGEGGDNLTLNLNPFQRKREAPVVFWSGLVQTGPEGVTVEYPVPDYFAGQLTLMAVAAGAEGYGSTQTKTVVRGPFVLTPNAPLFATPGDTFTLSLTVANNLESTAPEAARVAVSLTTSSNVRIVSLPEPAEIAPGREGTLRFEVAIQEPLGNATLTFKADAGGLSAQRSTTLSVRPATPRLTTVQSGYYRLPDHTVKPVRTLYPDFASREVSVAAVPLNLARGLATWLDESPHQGTEQIISRAMPRLLLSTEASFGFDRASSAAELDKVFAQLRGRQAPGGGFGAWSNQARGGLDFLTIYAADFLTSAREAGFAVPEDMLLLVRKNLREMAVLPAGSAVDQASQARAIYLLSRNGEVTTNYLLNLRDQLEKSGPWRTGPAALWVASTHALLRQNKEAVDILKEWKAAKKPAVRLWRFWQEQPLALDSMDLVLLCRHFPDLAGSLNYDDLRPLLTALEKGEFNTYSAACSVQALKEWSNLQKQSGVQTSLTELTKGAPSRLLAAPGAGLLRAEFTAGATAVQFGLLRPPGAPDLGAFYQMVESGFDRGLPAAPVRAGMEITRRWSVNGRPVDRVQVGQSVEMEILVRNLGNEPVEDVAIVDLLPGGWEVEESTLRSGPNGAPGADSVDMREDRNLFYTTVGGRNIQRFHYQLRPLCAGTTTVPPVTASSLYRPEFQARSSAGILTALPR